MRDPDAAALLEPLGEDERFETWHLVRRDGSLVGAGAGLVDLALALPLTRVPGRILARLPGTLVEGGYRLIARHRSRLGRLVPDGPAPRRFP
jgi:predicted DCC family thiol-disulfide oxidoreductase YuxK